MQIVTIAKGTADPDIACLNSYDKKICPQTFVLETSHATSLQAKQFLRESLKQKQTNHNFLLTMSRQASTFA